MDKYKISAEQLDRIEQILSKGHRVELIPTKDGIKFMYVRREEMKLNGKKTEYPQ